MNRGEFEQLRALPGKRVTADIQFKSNSMMINCDQLRRFVEGFALVKQCDVIRNGMLRFATPFQYADGSHIDLFVAPSDSQKITLTDLGQTIAYLLDMRVKPWTTKRRKQAVNDICQALEVQQNGGQFQIEVSCDAPQTFQSAVVQLSQACLRISDLAMTQRFRAGADFKDELEEFVAGMDIPYERPYQLQGRLGKPVEVDFHIQGRKTSSLLMTISTASTPSAHNLCIEIFRRWYDLSNYLEQYQFVTSFDTSHDVFRPEDLNRIRDFSNVFGYPDENEALHELLAA